MKTLLLPTLLSWIAAAGLVAQVPEPLHYWDFNEYDGAAVADRGTANAPATLLNGANKDNFGVTDYGLTLTQANSAARYQAQSQDALSLLVWFRHQPLPDASTPYSGRFIEAPAYTFFVSNDPVSLVFEYRYDDNLETKWRWTMDPASFVNEWHQAAVVFDPSLPTNQPTLYLDGQVVSGGTLVEISAGGPVDNTGAAYIGNRAEGDRGLLGQLDEVQIYDALLSGQQIDEVSISYVDPDMYRFFDREYRGGDWLSAHWLDWIFIAYYPWIYSPRHGWMYAAEGTFGNGVIYMAAPRKDTGEHFGWVTMYRDTPHFVWHYGVMNWMEHDADNPFTRYWDFTNNVYIETTP